MSSFQIQRLHAWQQNLIPDYREKWREIALKPGPISRQKAAEAVQLVYAAIGQKKPKIIFCDSPYTAWDSLLRSKVVKLIPLAGVLKHQLSNRLDGIGLRRLDAQLEQKLWRQLYDYQLDSQIVNQLTSKLRTILRITPKGTLNKKNKQILLEQLNNCIHPEEWASFASWFDFCISVLKCKYNRIQWEALQALVAECGGIFPYQGLAIVCDRPIKLSLDRQQQLHAEGEAAVQFADGLSLYAYHGLILPEKYGTVHPHNWQAEWLLQEPNAELRRMLIQEIGYARICQELQATPLDTWREYTLLRIDHFIDIDRQPIYLLKMTCPSTRFIHALRVPPNITSAREAITWVNWGVEPETFAVQS